MKSLAFSKGEKRTDLREDFEKSVFVIQEVLKNDDKNDFEEKFIN